MKTTTMLRPLSYGLWLLLLAFSLFFIPARAANIYWGGGDGNFNDANWFTSITPTTPTTVPGSSDTARISSGTVTIGADVSIITNYADIGRNNTGDLAVLNVDGYYQTNNAFSLGLVESTNTIAGTGILNIGASGTVQLASGRTFQIGHNNNATGIVNIQGLLNTSNITMGNAAGAIGKLNLLADGTLNSSGTTFIGNSAGASGTAIVSGLWENSGPTNVGNTGAGYLEIGQTGTVKVGTILTIGNAADSTGTVIVDGYLGIATYAYVGSIGAGYLEITETGTVTTGIATPTTNGYIHISRNATTGSGTVKVAGLLNVGQGSLHVGYAGAGYLEITETGTVNVGTYTSIGSNNNGDGTVIVRGLMTHGSYLRVGGNNGTNSTGFVDIASTGTVKTTTYTSIGAIAGNTGITRVAGLLDVGSYLNTGDADTGFLNILSTGTVKVGSYAYIGNTATTTGTALVAGLFNVATNLSIGNSGTGVLDIQSGGTVLVGGTTIIGNAATGNGTLLLNGGVLETRQLALGAGSATILINGGTLRAAADTDNFFVNFPELNIDAVGGSVLFDTQAFSVTATNALAGAATATFDKLGSGSLMLSGNSSAYAGSINVRAGSLDLGSTAHIGGAVTIASGAAMRPTVTGGVVDDLTIASGGALDLRNAALTAGNVTLADGAIWRYSLAGQHELSVLGNIDVAGTGTIYLDRDGVDIDLLYPVSYTLASYDTITGDTNLTDPSKWRIAASDFSHDSVLSIDLLSVPNKIKITINDAGIEFLRWQGGNGLWDATSTTWIDSTASNVAWNTGAFAIFEPGTGTVDIDGLHTIFGLQFGDNVGTTTYTLDGTGTLTSNGTMVIRLLTAADTATINAALEAPSLTKLDLGTLVLGGTATFAGAAVIGEGTLEIAPTGAVAAVDIEITSTAGKSAAVKIAGILTSSGSLYVGKAGDGLLTIAETGTLIGSSTATSYLGYSAGSSGTAIVRGYWNASTLVVGGTGKGYVEVASTGTLINGNFYGADYEGSLAEINVAGYWQSNAFVLGQRGAATLAIAETGTVIANGNSTLGNYANSIGTLGIGGYYNTTGTLFVGANGAGYLEILNGGTLQTLGTGTISQIGHNAGSSGTVIIRGGGLWESAGGINIGREGTGFLHVENGAFLNVTNSVNFTIGDTTNGIGSVVVDGSFRNLGTVRVGLNGTGDFKLGSNGVATTGAIIAGSAAGSNGTVIVEGNWNITAGSSQIGNNGTGTVIIEEGASLVSQGANNYFLLGYQAGSSGTGIIRGLLNTGTRADGTNANLIIAQGAANAASPTIGVLTIERTGTVIASGDITGTTVAFSMARNNNAIATLNLEGALILTNGIADIANAGQATINIASSGTMLVGGLYRQGAGGALNIAYDPNRSTPYIAAGSASLSGTLQIAGMPNSGAYTPIAKSSELASGGILILTATSGNISGNFTAFTGFGAGAPDYIVPGGSIKTDPGTGFAHYRAGYALAWNAPTGAHGTFTLGEGETFEVDTALVNRLGEVAPGWDRKSLAKAGPGTLVLSAQNTFTGTLAINAGTLRLGGPAIHSYGPLVNKGVLDFGPAPSAGFRTVEVASLAGDGSFRMTIDPGAGTGDRLVIRGNAAGTHQLLLAAADGATAPTGGSPATILATIAGTNNATFNGGLDYNGTNYAVARDSAGSIILATNGQAGVVDPIRGIPGSQSLMWFASQDNLSRRLGELRTPDNAPAGDYSIWLRARAEHANLGSGTNMRPFDMDLFGFELGADKTFTILPTGRIVIGLYAGYGHAKQDFDPRAGTGTADGTSDQISLGIYASWLHNAGWFANLTLSGARYDNEFTSADQSGNPSRGKYNDNALGASLELGKRIALDRVIGAGWFAEPSAQASHARLIRDDYRTTGANRLGINADNAVITRLRATLRAGRVWREVEISARAGVAHETSTGGEIRIDASRWRPNVDGTRAEAGVGVIWRPWNVGHLYFDYGFATGDSYQKPWSFSLGYRHEF